MILNPRISCGGYFFLSFSILSLSAMISFFPPPELVCIGYHCGWPYGGTLCAHVGVHMCVCVLGVTRCVCTCTTEYHIKDSQYLRVFQQQIISFSPLPQVSLTPSVIHSPPYSYIHFLPTINMSVTSDMMLEGCITFWNQF